jgi:hypothetical protein
MMWSFEGQSCSHFFHSLAKTGKNRGNLGPQEVGLSRYMRILNITSENTEKLAFSQCVFGGHSSDSEHATREGDALVRRGSLHTNRGDTSPSPKLTQVLHFQRQVPSQRRASHTG